MSAPAVASTSQINPSDVPEFERPQAADTKLVSGVGSSPSQVAKAQDASTIEVDKPSEFTGGVQAHELVHQIQMKAGLKSDDSTTVPQEMMHMVKNGFSDDGAADVAKTLTRQGWDATYGLGDLSKVKNINQLSNEQQAEIPHQYMDQYVKAEKSGDAGAIDKLNTVYEPMIRQLRNMANPSKDTINTTPDAPGAPPAAITGVAVPVKGMMSNSTRSVALKGHEVHNPPVAKSGKAWYNGAAALGK